MKKLSLALAVAGLLAGTLLTGWFGFAHVADAVTSIGWDGFGLLLAVQIPLFVLLGLAWRLIAGSGSAPTFVWGRAVRDAATNCLPFSPVGGYVLGARALTLHGVPGSLATASVLADVTAEVLAQMLFVLGGLCLLLARDVNSPAAPALAIGLAVGVLAVGGFFWAQRGGSALFARLGSRIIGRSMDETRDQVAAVQAELGRIYARSWRLLLAVCIHLAGWVAAAAGTWLAYRLMGADLGFADALAIEAMLRGALAATFIVPGNAGTQEAAYAGFGMLFGLPPDLSLGVSLVGRARDLALGVPVLLVSQWAEVRRLRPARRGGT